MKYIKGTMKKELSFLGKKKIRYQSLKYSLKLFAHIISLCLYLISSKLKLVITYNT